MPKYAILSHTWGENEVSYREIIAEARPVDKAGYSKITASCKQACRDGWEYIWIDTCCIDKTSSAELSEAINSMFRWYRGAEICYAYMVDVDARSSLPEAEDPDQLESFRQSRWFTRGWTLQELLAPEEVIFFDREWRKIGDKSGLPREISSATNIQYRDIRFPIDASVAAKMSWASRRETTRVEDLAYCLLGLFEVNMPLLYGEGQKAFLRLQHEILSVNPDESLFAWRDSNLLYHGIFAQTPAAFTESGNIIPSHVHLDEKDEPMSVTNRGLAIRPLLWLPDADTTYFAVKDESSKEPIHGNQNDGQEVSRAVSNSEYPIKCLLLSCTLNYKPDMVISIIVQQRSANTLVRVERGTFCIHHLEHALGRRSRDTQTMFISNLDASSSLDDGIWFRVRRAPFGRRFSLLHYDLFRMAKVLRASSEFRSQQMSWDTVIEHPWCATFVYPTPPGNLWFCTEDNDLFAICWDLFASPGMEVLCYRGKYSPDQSYPNPIDLAKHLPNEHWNLLSQAKRTPEPVKHLFYGQLPSSNYLAIRAGKISPGPCQIDVVVDKQLFPFYPDSEGMSPQVLESEPRLVLK